jgi:acetoin:2,6-dichlorophenolindophenol oxidoreductase subunit beta
MRQITYCEALCEGLSQEMEKDPSVFVYGIGAPDKGALFGSLDGIFERFGTSRCKDTPISEDTMTGVGIGAALAGMRPVHVHIRVDFLLLAMNQIANSMSILTYNSGGELSVPMVIRVVIGRGWGQGSQHSKSMMSNFARIPGLKVIAPTTPRDAKGMLISAIRDDNPVLCFEHRWLYWQKGACEVAPFEIELGKAAVIREGADITIIAVSWMNVEAVQASQMLENYHGVSAEVVDLRSLAPIDWQTIFESVRKTGRCLVAENDWLMCGISSEITSKIYEQIGSDLIGVIPRIGFAPSPCPTTRALENQFYPSAKDIFKSVEQIFGLSPANTSPEEFFSHERRFKGPF